MPKRILKWFFMTAAVLAVAVGIFLVNLIWFRPWSLNLFYDKVFAQFLFTEPELLLIWARRAIRYYRSQRQAKRCLAGA
ncbi:MAG: hypothetical protein ABI233_08590 [Chthoniobacterales bacterium]